MLRLPILSALSIYVLATAPTATVTASEEGPYIGIFGGIGTSPATTLQQKGAVYLNPPAHFPMLPIDAVGNTGKSHLAVGGMHLGYMWNRWHANASWGVQPAAEIEGIYLGKHTPTGVMPVTPAFLGTQYVTVPLDARILMANAVFNIHTPFSDRVLPYFGFGIGVAFLSVTGSDSANPSEPGINHFNSNPDSSDPSLALQAKMGIKSELFSNIFLFVEYRYLTINPTSFTFGSTDYPGLHLPTTNWHLNLGRQQYHLFITGLQYKF